MIYIKERKLRNNRVVSATDEHRGQFGIKISQRTISATDEHRGQCGIKNHKELVYNMFVLHNSTYTFSALFKTVTIFCDAIKICGYENW